APIKSAAERPNPTFGGGQRGPWGPPRCPAVLDKRKAERSAAARANKKRSRTRPSSRRGSVGRRGPRAAPAVLDKRKAERSAAERANKKRSRTRQITDRWLPGKERPARQPHFPSEVCAPDPPGNAA